MARSIRKWLGELDEGHLVQTERGERIFSEGDCVYFLRNDRDLGVKNGTLGTIVEIDDQSLKVAFHKDESDKLYHEAFSLDRYNDLDYGYTATIHKAQGVSVDQSFILASQYLDRHATYVGMTRHKDNVELFGAKKSLKITMRWCLLYRAKGVRSFHLTIPSLSLLMLVGLIQKGC